MKYSAVTKSSNGFKISYIRKNQVSLFLVQFISNLKPLEAEYSTVSSSNFKIMLLLII